MLSGQFDPEDGNVGVVNTQRKFSGKLKLLCFLGIHNLEMVYRQDKTFHVARCLRSNCKFVCCHETFNVKLHKLYDKIRPWSLG